MSARQSAESDALTVRTTSTGVKVIEGNCPHCGHSAMDHWSDGCKGARGGADHCRMDPWKLERLARPIPPSDPICNERGVPESECPPHCAHGRVFPPGTTEVGDA